MKRFLHVALALTAVAVLAAPAALACGDKKDASGKTASCCAKGEKSAAKGEKCAAPKGADDKDAKAAPAAAEKSETPKKG